MPETTSPAAAEKPELFRHPIITLQARFETLEAEARGRLKKAIGASNDALHGLDDALARMSREDWLVPGMRKRIDGLRARAENLRANALKRVAEMPGSAVSALASGSREPVQKLAKRLERLASKLEVEKAVEEKKN